MGKNVNYSTVEVSLSPQRRADLFLSGLHKLVSIITKFGGSKAEIASPGLVHFRALSEQDQMGVITKLATTLGACEEMIAGGLNPRQSGPLAWRVLLRMGYQIQSDAFGTYVDGDVIEVYNSQNRQVFASLNLLETSSYSLEDLYCRPWIELWQRDDTITQTLFEKATYVMSGACRFTLTLEIPFHQVEERFSAKSVKAIVRPKIFSPVTDEYGEVGFICLTELKEMIDSPLPV